jgi:hypothetical protein
MDYENKRLGNCFYSTLIASFLRTVSEEAGIVNYELLLRGWLKQYDGFTEEDIRNIVRLAGDGRLEFESNCSRYLKKHIHDNLDTLRKNAF